MEYPIDTLLAYAAQLHASDLHISSGTEPVVRVNGKLIPLNCFTSLRADREESKESVLRRSSERHGQPNNFSVAEPPGSFAGVVYKPDLLFEPILPEKQLSLLKRYGECDFAYGSNSGHRFRINLYKSSGSVSAAIRLIPGDVPTCDQLGLPESVRRLSSLQSGLVLVTGVTGSGKSTTLAAILDEINRNRAVHIVTLEDPVEYRFTPSKSLIHQREVGNDTVSFASGLRAALREDPDVIMVGELRDLETTAVAVTAAETGHLVFATLHTRGAADTVNRVIDVFPQQQQRQIRVQLAGSLQAVISQQLVPDTNGGRVAAFEIMIVTPALRNLIREGKTQQIDSYIQTGAQYGMQTMEEAVGKLRREGKIVAFEKQ